MYRLSRHHFRATLPCSPRWFLAFYSLDLGSIRSGFSRARPCALVGRFIVALGTTTSDCISTQAKHTNLRPVYTRYTNYSLVYSPPFLPTEIWYAVCVYRVHHPCDTRSSQLIMRLDAKESLFRLYFLASRFHATLKQRTVGVRLGLRESHIAPWQLSAQSERRDNKRTREGREQLNLSH